MPFRKLALGFAYLLLVLLLEAISSVGLFTMVGVTPWNPSAGLSVAAAYLGGLSFAPFILLSHLLSHVLGVSNPSDLPSFASALLLGGIYLGAGLFMRRLVDFDPSLSTVNDCLRLILVGIVTALFDTICHVGGSLASGAITHSQLFSVIWRNYVGTLVGILTLTPLVLLGSVPHRWPAPSREQAAQVVTVIASTAVIFGFPAATAYQLFYLLFLPVMWVALRQGIVGTIIVLNICQVAIITAAQFKLGFLPGLAPLQTMLVVLVVTGLLVGAIVTERQASAQRVRDQHAALNRSLRVRSAGETAAAIAHEINQPLTAAATYAGIVEAALARGDTALARETSVKLRQQCDRASAVVTSMRELFSRGGLTQASVDLGALVREIGKLHADTLAAKGIELNIDVARNLPPMLIDATQMQQALHNLLHNSIESIAASGRRGAIAVSVHVDADQAAVLEVRDNGPGFPQGFGELASTPFLTTKKHGSGLGLAVARSVAETHGGSLVIVPSSIGAIVRLKLPLPILVEEQCRVL